MVNIQKKYYGSKAFLVAVIFEKIGFRTYLKSTTYISEAMLIYIDKPNLKFASGIYPVIASRFEVNPGSMSSLFHSAIKRAWANCPMEVINVLSDHPLFTEQKKTPTVEEFFFMVRRWVLKNYQN